MSADSHCHLNDPAFDEDFGPALDRARAAGVERILNVGYDIATSRVAIELAERHEGLYASVGVHPHNAASLDGDALAALERMAAHPKVVAIGETGLDYFRDRAPRPAQKEAFGAQLSLAKKVDKPLIVHCREAMADCLDILAEGKIEQGVMHCFAGTPDDVRRVVDLGMYISFAGNVTYPKAGDLRESLRAVPGHRLLLETDAPYLAPQKKRGGRCEPAFLPYTVETAAKVREVTVEDMNRITEANFNAVFGVGDSGEGEIAYRIRNSLYLNVTKECDNECYFCGRFYSDTVQGHNLKIRRDPTAAEMIGAIGDPAGYDEIVFCGFGEPSLRLDNVLEVAKAVKAAGGHTRLNTNGHASRIAGRDVTPELAGLIDRVSVSLNAPDEATYNAICHPTLPGAYAATVEFIKAAKERGLDVTATVVAIPGKVDLEACRRLAEDELGVKFRAREYDLLG